MQKTKNSFLVKLIASGLGTGYSPVAPGTAGSLLGLGIWWLWSGMNIWLQLSFIITTFFLGVWAASLAERDWGHDAGKIVVDEVAGMWITLWLLPQSYVLYAVGFLLFRGFDIWKPLGARRIQKLPGGWGVMMDDMIAGVYANIICQIICWFFWNDQITPFNIFIKGLISLIKPG
jgi:phosphatidylglycerophosphatase A